MTDVGRIRVDNGAEPSPRHPDEVIAHLAEAQDGVVARWQLMPSGLDGRVRRGLAAGRLHVVHHGVYAVGHRVLSLRGRWWAAVLACGPGALLSHGDAAALRSLRRASGRDVHVTIPGRSRREHRGITVHRPRLLHPDDVDVHDGIPCASLARTLLDLAAVLRPHQLARVIEQAELLRVLDMGPIEALIARSPRRAGVPALTAALWRFEPTEMTRSELEARFREICRAAGLGDLTLNAPIPGTLYEVDALWPDARLVVEVDHWHTHGTRTAFERDRVRDATLQGLGFRVVRVTDRQLAREPRAVAERLRAMLLRFRVAC